MLYVYYTYVCINLSILIIIGYSFCDDGVNDILKQLPIDKVIITACKDGNKKSKGIISLQYDFQRVRGLT